MQPLLSFQELVSRTGLGERSTRRYVSELGILPVSMQGHLHFYDQEAVAQINSARLALAERRRERRSRRARRSGRSGRVLTLDEAKRNAKGKA